jgi:DNA-binding SARP family transcriptional activator
MGNLELKFLGDLEVIRDGVSMPLPPSKKTRALLAYLVLHERPFRRERLCELLWEVPDDPRGSLRWSLSKLRRLVDEPDTPRVVADRTNVGFDLHGVGVDLLHLKALASTDLGALPLADLQDAAGRFRGNFLEGLELANFYEFHAWCVSERELASKAQSAVLSSLVKRLRATPDQALPYARDLVALAPYDEDQRAALIELLVALGRADEAEQQYKMGQRMLEEVGVVSTGVLYQAWRGAPGGPGAPGEGRGERVAPTSVPAPVMQPTIPAPYTSSLIGRDAELEQMRAAIASVAQGSGARVILVCGEPGIGKSRLLEAAGDLIRQTDGLVLEASAFESESMRPFALWIDALRKLPADSVPDIFAATDHDNRDRLFENLSGLVRDRGDDKPVFLLFDDLQWCDESSVAALHYVARMNRDRPFFAVLGARDGELRDNAAAQQALRGLRRDKLLFDISLGPLPQAAVRDLIKEHAPEVNGDALSRECGGNPLLAIELARAQSAGASGGSLVELVRERLGRFDLEAADVLCWAAILNPRIDVGWLSRVTGLDTIQIGEALEAAEGQAILTGDGGGYRFSHDLVARGVYAEISPTRRRVMHGRVAELLEQETAFDLGHAADLAHHAVQSGDSGLGARAMVSAGRLCLRFFANDDAMALARQGLQLAEKLSDAERVCLNLDLHDIILAAAPLEDWQAAAERYVTLAEQALDHGALSHARLGYHMASTVRWMHGQWAGAREESLQAERVVRGGSDEDHIIGMAETAKCLAMLERDLTQADAMLMEAQALAERKRVIHHAIPAALGILRFHENRLDEAEELFKDSRTLCKSAGDRVNEFLANEYLVMIDFERERYAAALARCAALIEIGEKLREGSEAPFARALQSLCEYALECKGDDAVDATDRSDGAGFVTALEDLRIADAKHRLAYLLTRVGLLELEQDCADDAVLHASEALEYAQLLERPTELILAHAILAEAKAQLGDAAGHDEHASAIAVLDEAAAARWAWNRTESLLGKTVGKKVRA